MFIRKDIRRIKEKVTKDNDLLAVIIFGSSVKERKYSDIDICMVLKPENYNNLFLSKKKLEYLVSLDEKFDIQVFQQLPLYIKMRILKEGKILFCRNENLLYKLAYETIKDFECYRRLYDSYLEGVACA